MWFSDAQGKLPRTPQKVTSTVMCVQPYPIPAPVPPNLLQISYYLKFLSLCFLGQSAGRALGQSSLGVDKICVWLTSNLGSILQVPIETWPEPSRRSNIYNFKYFLFIAEMADRRGFSGVRGRRRVTGTAGDRKSPNRLRH